MNWAQFKHRLYYLCPAGTVVASWSLTQEVAGSNNLFKTRQLIAMENQTANCNGKPDNQLLDIRGFVRGPVPVCVSLDFLPYLSSSHT